MSGTLPPKPIIGANALAEEFNPLAPSSIIGTLTRKLFEQTPQALPPLTPFYGAGVYALYYRGSDSLYAPLSGMDTPENHRPLYVGQAQPEGGLAGALRQAKRGTELFDRLWEHAQSIVFAQNLALNDFLCRYLVVEHIFIGLSEHILIGEHRPPWNKSGFGIHAPGEGRADQQRSIWDMLHPGRPHAAARPPHRYGEQYCRLYMQGLVQGKSAREADYEARTRLGIVAVKRARQRQKPTPEPPPIVE